MKNNGQEEKRARTRSFSQEMQQAFVEWVKKLPFIKRDISEHSGREDLEEKPSDQANAPHPADSAIPERPPDNNAGER